MSIATQRGDGGETSLAGGIRVSKADLLVEAYGTVDELISALGLARALASNKEIAEYFKISEDTVKHHLSNIFDKLGVSTRLELALFAVNQALPLKSIA